MMKQKLLLFICLLSFGALSAQTESYSKEVAMSLGNLPALVVDMNEIDVKDAESYWTKYIKDYGKLKKNRKADELFAEGIRIPLIKPSKIDLFSKVEDLKGSSRLYVWIDNGDNFLSEATDASTYANAKKFLDDFAVMAEKQHVESLLKVAEKQLDGFEKDLKKLVKNKEGYEKAIEDAKEKIAKNEKNIQENTVAQENKTIEIEDQRSKLESIKERLSKVGKVKTKM